MADITEQDAKFGDTDNTLLLKAAKALQTLADGGVVAAAGTLTGDILAENVQQANILYNFDGTKMYAYAEDIKQNENFVAGLLFPGGSTTLPTLVAVGGLLTCAVCNNGSNLRLVRPLDIAKWAGKSVTLGMTVLVNGVSAGTLAIRFALTVRNTTLDGISTNVAQSGGTPDVAVYDVTDDFPAPTVASAPITAASPTIAIPANATQIGVLFAMERSNAGLDTNTDTAYMFECWVREV